MSTQHDSTCRVAYGYKAYDHIMKRNEDRCSEDEPHCVQDRRRLLRMPRSPVDILSRCARVD